MSERETMTLEKNPCTTLRYVNFVILGVALFRGLRGVEGQVGYRLILA